MDKERYICEVDKSFDIFDNLYKEYPSMQEICRTLNKQHQRIAELEEQLKDSIRPKFKIGQEVWAIVYDFFMGEFLNPQIITGKIDSLFINRDSDISYGTMSRSFKAEKLYATEEDAKLKLEELRG